MILERVNLKFEDQLYKAEVPVNEGFTGQVALVFHWKDGILLKAQVNKSASASFTEKVDNILLGDENVLGNKAYSGIDS